VTIIAALKLAWKVYKALRQADKTLDAHRDKTIALIIGKASACLVAALLLQGCATASVERCRAAGVEPTRWEKVQLNVCDGYSRAWGWVPFGGGQD
jgi:hypothetical protein